MATLTPPPARAVVPRTLADSAPFNLGRSLGLALLGAYALLRLKHVDWWDPLDDIDLAIHEAGHIVFSPFGERLTMLGGSLFQLIVPAVFVIYFARTRQQLGVATTMVWLGASLLNVARYVADARAQDLPLLGGDGATHDWNWLLDSWNALPLDHAIAQALRAGAATIFLLAVVIGLASLRGEERKKT